MIRCPENNDKTKIESIDPYYNIISAHKKGRWLSIITIINSVHSLALSSSIARFACTAHHFLDATLFPFLSELVILCYINKTPWP
jgi:hypothetical protein